MCGHNLARDRKAQPRSVGLCRSEGPLQAPDLIFIHPDAIVGDLHHCRAIIGPERELRRSAGANGLRRVEEEMGQQLLQRLRIPAHLYRAIGQAHPQRRRHGGKRSSHELLGRGNSAAQVHLDVIAPLPSPAKLRSDNDLRESPCSASANNSTSC